MRKTKKILGFLFLAVAAGPLWENTEKENLLTEQRENDPFFLNSPGMIS